MTPAAKQSDLPTFDGLAPDYGLVQLESLLSGHRRLDAEVYLSGGFKVREAILREYAGSVALGTLAEVTQPDRLKGVRVAPEHGVPYLLPTQAFDIWPSPRKWLAPSKIPNICDYYVEPGWILVTRSGSVGQPIIAYAPHIDRIISDDLLRVKIRDIAIRGYLYTFLLTHQGRAMMLASHYGNVIKHLEAEHLIDLPVPVIPELVEEIGAAILAVSSARDEAYRLDMGARELFEKSLGIPPSASGASFSTSSTELNRGGRRLDASAHNPLARSIGELYRERARAVVRVGSVARAFVPNRFKRIFGEAGTPYLDSEPIFKINPGISKVLTPATPIKPEDYFVEAGWLLIACSGQIYGLNGQAILATRWHEGKVVTQHIMRLVPDTGKVQAGYLEVALTHPTLGQPLILSRAHGTSVPELDPEDIEGLPLPRLASDIESEIATMAERASELRMEADEKENGAVERLERELERRIGSPARKPPKIRPDVAETAYRVMLEATGQAPKTAPPNEREATDKNTEAVRRGKKGGRPRRKSGS